MSRKEVEKRLKKLEIEAKIEWKRKLAEIGSDYQPIRFSRIKYKSNDQVFLDIRRFQRGYDEHGEDQYFPTKVGFRVSEREFIRKVVNALTVPPDDYVHPLIKEKAFPLLSSRQFESAVREAYKCVEVKIRKAAEFDESYHGVKLIRAAFHPENGPLADKSRPVAEREAVSNFISGAYGLHRNPPSHRDVALEFDQAFESVVIASNILKLVEAGET